VKASPSSGCSHDNVGLAYSGDRQSLLSQNWNISVTKRELSTFVSDVFNS
jgi:hypothetical protein